MWFWHCFPFPLSCDNDTYMGIIIRNVENSDLAMVSLYTHEYCSNVIMYQDGSQFIPLSNKFVYYNSSNSLHTWRKPQYIHCKNWQLTLAKFFCRKMFEAV